jgi:hypothetical protein
MKVLWILYLIAGAPQSLGEFYTKEDCRKALDLALEDTFGGTFEKGAAGQPVRFLCVPYLASEAEGQP